MSPRHSTGAGRLALVFSSLRGGGIQRVMLTLAEGFLAKGLEVDLVIVNARGELEPLVPPHARIVDLRARRSTYALPGLVAYLRRQRPAAVLASQTHINLLTLAARGLSRVPTRVVVSEHVALDAVLRHAATWRERLFPVGARWYYGRAEGIVVVSQATAARFAEATGLPAGMTTIIYNPVVTPDLLTQAAAPVDHPWFAPGELPVILSAGRLTRQKDHATLLRAFALARRTIRARLLILGEGEQRTHLEALIDRLELRSDVQLKGFVLNPFAYMARARLFVLASRWEGFGNVLVEAMACGTPVVSTDCPSGPAEILQGGARGTLVPVGDHRALAEAMVRTLHHPPAASGRSRALDFSSDRAVQRYLDTLLP
jgi:glycosyltransferase involved in cell wall biosynthesis